MKEQILKLAATLFGSFLLTIAYHYFGGSFVASFTGAFVMGYWWDETFNQYE